MKIYKYLIDPNNSLVRLHKGAQILSVQVQHEKPVFWALVDPEAPLVYRALHVYPTGRSIPDNPGKFIGTFQLEDGQLVFHLFDRGETT